MLRLDADLSESDDQSTDSVGSGGMTSRREKPPQSPLPTHRNRPKSATPYGRGRYSRSNANVHPNLLPPITSSPALGRTLPTLEDEEMPSIMTPKRIQVRHTGDDDDDDDDDEDKYAHMNQYATTLSPRYIENCDAQTGMPPMFSSRVPSPIPRREALSPLSRNARTNKSKKSKANKNKIGAESLGPNKERKVMEVKGRPQPKPRSTESPHSKLTYLQSHTADSESQSSKVNKVKLAVILGYVACGIVIVGLLIGITILVLNSSSK